MNETLENIIGPPRQMLLLWVTLLVVMTALVAGYGILPAYDRWRMLQSAAKTQAMEYSRLWGNLALARSVNEQFEQLGPKAFQTASDEITLSQFLIELETLVRLPSLTLINAKPMAAGLQGACKIYRVKLSLSGKLQEILRFVSEVTSGESVIGLEGFSVRGVQDRSLVESTLSLWMVRLLPEESDGYQAKGGFVDGP